MYIKISSNAQCAYSKSKFIAEYLKILQSPVEVSAVSKRKPRRTSTELKRQTAAEKTKFADLVH